MTGYDPGTPISSSGPPPGWYNDPGGVPALRWWDGSQWTQHTRPAGEPQPGTQPQLAAAAAESPEPVVPSQYARRRWPRGRALIALVASSVVVIAGATTAIVIVTSGPSYPHPWCGPVLAQFHAHESQDAFDSNMTALEGQGAPVANLISDGDTVTEDQALADSSDLSSGFSYLTEEMNELSNVDTELQALNRDCAQPANAYKNDNY